MRTLEEIKNSDGFCTVRDWVDIQNSFFWNGGEEIDNWWIVADFVDNDLCSKANRQALEDKLKDNGLTENDYEFLTIGSNMGGSFELLIISPDSTLAYDIAKGYRESINEYPLYDEDLYYQLESDTISECWNDYGRDELRKEIEKQFDVDLDSRSDSDIDELQEILEDNYNPEIENDYAIFYITENVLACKQIVTDWLNK